MALSKRSNNPPWPGINVPLSLTPAWRLYLDSIKSPMVPNTLTRTLKTSQLVNCNSLVNLKIKKLPMAEKNTPPKNPSTVFFGDTLSNNFCLP